MGAHFAPDAERRNISLFDADDNLVGKTEGYFLPLSHLDGGTIVFPALDPDQDEVAYVEYGKTRLSIDSMPKAAFAEH